MVRRIPGQFRQPFVTGRVRGAVSAAPVTQFHLNEQCRGRDHNPGNQRGQSREQEKIVQEYAHGSLSRALMRVIPQSAAHSRTVAEK